MRYYSPDQGRWINRDPLTADHRGFRLGAGLSRGTDVVLGFMSSIRSSSYLFTENRPIDLVDFRGLMSGSSRFLWPSLLENPSHLDCGPTPSAPVSGEVTCSKSCDRVVGGCDRWSPPAFAACCRQHEEEHIRQCEEDSRCDELFCKKIWCGLRCTSSPGSVLEPDHWGRGEFDARSHECEAHKLSLLCMLRLLLYYPLSPGETRDVVARYRCEIWLVEQYGCL